MLPKHKITKGFTLLEVLIAVFIFTIAAVIMTSALHHVLNLQSETDKHAERMTELQMSFMLLSRDIEQAIDRPITDGKGMKEASLQGSSDNITLTRGGLLNPDGQLVRSTLQRVRYTVQNNTLTRETWAVLDQVASTQPSSRPLLSGVKDIRIEYLDQKGTFHTNWPPSNQSNADALPRGVRITLTLDKWGKIRQFYLIAGTTFA